LQLLQGKTPQILAIRWVTSRLFFAIIATVPVPKDRHNMKKTEKLPKIQPRKLPKIQPRKLPKILPRKLPKKAKGTAFRGMGHYL